ncbi:ATP-dependent DNA helicase DDX11 [Lycorma delicatula]|uniref:ATP-dependent DNA helicase DDX11 n=1 Tax=Lycorma delicatula TaxID=130591 RepID=UPI003F51265A
MDEKQTDHLTPPEEFPFPFVPYSIQKDFMRNLYIALEEGKLGIFESPTGTGKSQSLICGSFRWLLDHEARDKRVLAEKIASLSISNNDSSVDWITSQAEDLEKQHSKYQLQTKLNKMLEKEERLKLLKKKIKEKNLRERKINKPKDKSEESVSESNEQIIDDLLENSEIDEIINEDKETDEEESDKNQEVKIIISSRTHSQLSQLVNEVKRSPYFDSVKLVTLASRNNFCINPSVKKLNSLSLINERCTDLQRNKKEKVTLQSDNGSKIKKSRCGNAGCSYLSSTLHLTEETLVSVMDVEDVVARGKQLNACPYYGTRSAVEDAQVVVVPYNILLHKSTREACGLSVKNSIVIIDEAHNLLDTIQHIHSAEVSFDLLNNAHRQLTAYRDQYKTKFSAYNLLNLNQLIYITSNLLKLISTKTLAETSTKIMLINDFLLAAKIDNYNFYKLLIFCKNSRLSQKMQGYVVRTKFSKDEKCQDIKNETGVKAFLKQIQSNNKKVHVVEKSEEKHEEKETVTVNSLPGLLSFLECLTNPSEDGRIICTYNNAKNCGGCIKFLLLNSSSHFKDIVQQARSVIVAGGTMQPITEFSHQLFVAAGASLDRVLHFSCGHVIPSSHILPITLTNGPTNISLDFSYTSKESNNMMDEVGRILLNITNIVPAGIVCFFTSYNYEQTVYQHLTKTGIISKISAKKKIFREPKESNQVDKVLQSYAKAVKSSNVESKLNGALLFSVVGGKLSEGLNFSDDLGRCIILVGMPYPNIKSAELQEKMAYLTSLYGGKAGEEHYENLCMKAVNQTIGRAVRHKEDYATIWLLDKRYSRTNTQNQLPQWIKTSLKSCNHFGQAMGMTARFFSGMSKT